MVNHQSRWNHRNFDPPPEPEPRRLNFLILTMPNKEIISVSFREGIDFIDEDWPEFGAFYILETE